MVGQAKTRLHTIEEQLEAARVDFEATQSASNKAAAAAQLAQNNAAAAAVHAAESAAAVSPLPSVAEEEEGPAPSEQPHALASIEDYEEPSSNHAPVLQQSAQYSDEQEQGTILYRNSLQHPLPDNQPSYDPGYEQADAYGDYKNYY